MEKVIITSADGHAVIPPELWPEYLDKKFHKYLQRLHEDRELFSGSMAHLGGLRVSDEQRPVFDKAGRFDEGQWGLWNHDVRIAEMDREGIAAEFAFPGDFRSIDLFWNTTNATYAIPALDAGARAYNRWCSDTFGKSKDRILMIAAPLSGLNIQDVLDEADWLADHGFAGTYTPCYCALPTQVPVFEPYWAPVFAAYAERGLTLITHAGYGMPQGYMHAEVEAAASENRAAGGDMAALGVRLMTGVFNDHGVFNDLRSRQVLWHFVMGGIFDRHPDLRMMITEVRADWIPAVLRMMDKVWEANRDKIACKRRPSEYWGVNMIAGLSFMKKSELAMRHEIGVKTMAFGRDYPHTEATWPNTNEYLGDLFQGVPEDEGRDILGENMVRFLGLDRAHLAKIADRIAPTYQELQARGAMPEALVKHLDFRCGYSEPAEDGRRLPELEAMLMRDIPRLAAAAAQLEYQ
jgi:hypothetical protein